jgi:hypothetical protein
VTTNGHNKNAAKRKKRSTPKATPAQQRARREYLEMTGHTFDPKRIAKIRSEWVD